MRVRVVDPSKRQRVSKGTPVVDRIRFHTVVDEHGCWVWQAKKHGGYGRMTITAPDGTQRSTPAHRASYEAHVGPIPEGLELDHLCRNAACCNPSHLEPVTRQENVRRALGWAVGPTRTAERMAEVREFLAHKEAS
jgi:hypothetical protein